MSATLRVLEDGLVCKMADGGDNKTCLTSPKIEIGTVAEFKVLIEKCEDSAFLIGVGNKDLDPDYYIGQGSTGISFYFKSDTKVIFGNTSSGYGKVGLQGDIITCILDTIAGTIAYKINWGAEEFNLGIMHTSDWLKSASEEWVFGVTMHDSNDLIRIL